MSGLLEVAIDGGPYALAAGSDGAMWVTLVHGGAIARVSPEGALRVFPVATDAKPSLIAAGPDGALWFTRAGDIAKYCYEMKPGIIPGSASAAAAA